MAREIINTEKAPAAIGPYVQAVADNGLLFISGQLGFDVEHGSVIPETVEEQATLSLKNLDAIMTAAGTDRTKVMKTTIFLTDMNDFAKVNEVYGAFFGESKPARSCVAVAALPKAAKVEIECIVSLKYEREMSMAEERVIKIGMLGLGTVGTGVYKVLKSQQEEMLPKLGARVELKKILVRNVEKAAAKVDDPSIITTSFEEIANDPEIEIVVEVMGGKQPAMNYILACLDAGKNVVTANKDLVASEGKKILATAKRNGKDFLYEASVAGGIPIIRPVKQCLAANHITELMGIFNGTTNFILTKMSQEGMEFGDALRLAQDMGYAEADPTADVEGLDAGRKVAILASAAFNSRVTFEDVYTEGITKITATDIEYAKEMGCTIKLLGVAKDTPEGIEARVHPMLIDSNHPLATVNDSYNAVFLTGDAVQDTMFYGRGAGELPTASAVVGDIFDVVRNILWNCCGRIGCTCYRECPIKRVGEIKSKYFVRMQIENRYGTLASVASVFGNNKVSIAQMLQKRVNGKYAEIVVITDEVKERHFEDAMQILGGMSMIQEISSTIRVY